MKKYVNKLKRIVAAMLSVAMVVSLFQWDLLRTFADGETTASVLDFIPAGATLEENKMNEPYPVAYVKNNEVTLYAGFTAGAQGAVYTGTQGEQIELANSYTYTAGEEKVVLYKYEYYELDGVMHTARNKGYMFIAADDISFEEVEKPDATETPEPTVSPETTPTPTPEATPATTPEATEAPQGGTITLDFVPNDVAVDSATATEKYAVINDTTIRVYKTPDYKSEGIELNVNAGTVIELVTAYTYSDGQVVYRYDYNGVENSELYNAALSELSGYPIIPAKYITVGVKTVENTTITDPDTSVSVTGLLPTTAELDTVPTTTSELPAGTDTTDISENALFYDFTLSNGGAYFEPSSTVKVTFPQSNINFVKGTEYTIYHVTDDGVVKTLGTEIYEGGDINVNVDGFSYIGLSADVDFETVPTFKAQFAVNPVKIYADTALKNYKEFATADTDIVNIEMKVIVSDGDNEVELYVISYNGYEGENSEMKEAITPSSGMAYVYVMVGDVKEYVEGGAESETPTEEDITYIYELLVQSGTNNDFEKYYELAINSGIFDYFTEEQKSEIDSIKTILEEMVKATVDWEEFDLKATLSSEGVKIYRNPVTCPNDYVITKTAKPLSGEETEETVEEIEFTNANILGKYVDVEGNIYYILETDNYSAFKGRIPYRYVKQYNVVISAKFNSLNQLGSFIQNDVVLYNDYSTSSENVEITDGILRGIFNVKYEIITTDHTGSQQRWYWIDTDGWTVDGTTLTSTYVKAENVKLATKLTDVTGVSVTGDIPEGATLSVTSKTLEETGLDNNVYPMGENSLFYDVTLLDTNNNETQPGEDGITVTFPEEKILASGLSQGDNYHIYHIHDDNVEISSAAEYAGGDIEMTFDSLSVVGLAETQFVKNFITDNGQISEENSETYPTGSELFATIVAADDGNITVYDYHQDDANGMKVSGTNGYVISLAEKIVYANDYVLYRFYYDGTDDDFSAVIQEGGYRFIPGEFVNIGIIDYDQLYNELLATETVEEWDDLVGSYTEEEWQLFLDGLTDEESTTLANHSNNLPLAIDKDAYDAYDALMATNSVASFNSLKESTEKKLLDSLPRGKKLSLFYHRLEMLGAEGVDKPENYELPGGPVESFTNAAPIVIQEETENVSEQPVMYASLYNNIPMLMSGEYPVAPVAVPSGSEYTTDESGALVMKKTAKPKNDGSGEYTITLEAYTTGEVTVTQNLTPVDITLVLDVSGSMNFCMVCGEEVTSENSTHNKYTYTKYTGTGGNNQEYWYEYAPNSYERAYYCSGSRLSGCSAGWYTETHSWKGHGGTEITGDIYTRRESGTESCTIRMNALKDAVQAFIDSTNTKNASISEADKKHRVAIVKFSGNYTNTVGNTTYKKDGYTYNYSQIVQQLTPVTGENVEILKNKVKALEPAGATQTDLGMQHAYEIINGLGATVREERKQVVIVFTDGTPTSFSGFDELVADNALKNSNKVKDLGATVYAISVANGAYVNAGGDLPLYVDPDEAEDTELNSLMNRFMHLLSSNNPTANDLQTGPQRTTEIKDGITYTSTGQKNSENEWSSYYLVPTNASDLTAIFGQISSSATGESSVDLGVSTTVKDIVTPQFVIPEGANDITVSSVDCLTYDEDTGVVTWSTTSTPLGATYTDENGDTQNVITISGNNVEVSGFDFNANYVAENGRSETEENAIGNFRGRKLVITIDIASTEDFLGGNNVFTNTDIAGVYDGETVIGNFATPTVDVPLKTINPVLEDQYIYVTNSADLDTMIAGSSDVDSYKYEYKLGEKTYNFNGINNKYVNVTYTVYDEENVIKTLTIPAEAQVGEWKLGDNVVDSLLSDLTSDKTYAIECKITPATTGSITEGKTGTDNGTVYIFKPEITFNDSIGWLGDTLIYGAGTNYTVGSEVWSNVTKGNSIINPMSGTKPSVTITCETNPKGTEGNIIVTTDDIPVQATVKIGTTDGVEDTHYTVKHTCTKANCSYRKNGEEFIIHVDTVSLDVSKKVEGTDKSGEFKFNVEFTGNAFNKDLTILKNGEGTALNVVGGKASIELTLIHGQTVSLTGLPVGAYKVTETVDIDRYDTTVQVDSETEINNTSAEAILSSKNIKDIVAYVNMLKAGCLTISKEIVMPDGFVAPTGDKFTIQVKQGDTVVDTVILEHGKTCEPITLVQGEYTIVETIKGDNYDTDESQNQTVTITAGQTTNATIKNPVKTGSLEIYKAVVDTDANIASKTDEEFEMTVTISGVADGKILQYKVGNNIRYATDNKIVLKNDETAVFSNLPVGVEYRVLENLTEAQDKYYTATYDTNFEGTIVGENTKTTITNTRKYGSLTITKVLQDKNGNALSANPGETFVFTVKNENENSTMQVVIAPQVNSSVTLTNLPLGKYIVEEDVNWSYKYNAVNAIVKTEVTETADGQATITNKAEDDKWLKSDAYAENKFTAVTTSAN